MEIEFTLNVSMNLKKFNTNYVGVHFGGSIYSMCDPWWMLMVMENIGKKYVVWDQKAQVHFVRPGTGKINLHLKLTEKHILEIKKETKNGKIFQPNFPVIIKNDSDKVVAKITKTLFIQEKISFEKRRAKKSRKTT